MHPSHPEQAQQPQQIPQDMHTSHPEQAQWRAPETLTEGHEGHSNKAAAADDSGRYQGTSLRMCICHVLQKRGEGLNVSGHGCRRDMIMYVGVSLRVRVPVRVSPVVLVASPSPQSADQAHVSLSARVAVHS